MKWVEGSKVLSRHFVVALKTSAPHALFALGDGLFVFRHRLLKHVPPLPLSPGYSLATPALAGLHRLCESAPTILRPKGVPGLNLNPGARLATKSLPIRTSNKLIEVIVLHLYIEIFDSSGKGKSVVPIKPRGVRHVV